MPVLQVPAGDEGGLGGLLILLKEVEKDEEEKRENDDEEEDMRGKRRDEEDMQPGGGGGHDCEISLCPFCHLAPSHELPPSRFFFTKNN